MMVLGCTLKPQLATLRTPRHSTSSQARSLNGTNYLSSQIAQTLVPAHSGSQRNSRLHAHATQGPSDTSTYQQPGDGWEEVNIDVKYLGQDDGKLSVQGDMDLSIPAAVVFEALSNFDRSPEIFRNIETSSATESESGKVVTQECLWKFLVFKGTFTICLDVEEAADAGQLVFRMRSSKFMKFFQGQWNIVETGPSSCHVSHRLTVQPVLSPSPAIAHYTSSVFKAQVDGIMGDLATEMERRHEAGLLS